MRRWHLSQKTEGGDRYRQNIGRIERDDPHKVTADTNVLE